MRTIDYEGLNFNCEHIQKTSTGSLRLSPICDKCKNKLKCLMWIREENRKNLLPKFNIKDIEVKQSINESLISQIKEEYLNDDNYPSQKSGEAERIKLGFFQLRGRKFSERRRRRQTISLRLQKALEKGDIKVMSFKVD